MAKNLLIRDQKKNRLRDIKKRDDIKYFCRPTFLRKFLAWSQDISFLTLFFCHCFPKKWFWVLIFIIQQKMEEGGERGARTQLQVRGEGGGVNSWTGGGGEVLLHLWTHPVWHAQAKKNIIFFVTHMGKNGEAKLLFFWIRLMHPGCTHPTNNVLLISFRLSSDAEILLMSTDWAYKLARKHVFWLSFHVAYHS